MPTDTTRTLVIAGSPAKLLRLAGLGVLMTAVSLAAARSLRDAPLDDRLIGYVGIVFFGLCTVVTLWRLARATGPVLTISPHGIRDTRIAAAVIPWSGVERISTWQAYGQKAMVLTMKSGFERQLGLRAVTRWTRGANRLLGADGLCIVAAGLKIDYDTLLQTCLDYLSAAQRR